MADLDTTPISTPVASENIVIKPEFQTNITAQFGNKNVEFFFPDFIEYFLPSQSYLQANVELQGRGRPIPNPSAAFHSFINTLRIYNGERSQLLSELVQYNTSVAQKFTYSKTDAIQNIRLNNEGQQAIDSYDQNLYYTLNNNTQVWSAYNLTNPAAAITNGTGGSVDAFAAVSKQCQIQTTLKSFMLNTDKFMPLNVLGGIRMDLQIEQMNRALTFTSGTLGIGAANGLMANKGEYILGVAGDFGPVDAPVGAANANYTANHVYPLKDDNNNTVGFVNIGALDGGNLVVPAHVSWVCSANNNFAVPNVIGAEYTIGGTGNPNDPGNFKVKLLGAGGDRVQFLGNGACAGVDANGGGSTDSPYYIEVATGLLLGSNNIKEQVDGYGTNTLRDPDRSVNAIPDPEAGLGITNQFPCNNNPFAIGDLLYINTTQNDAEKKLGIITGFACGNANLATTQSLRIYYKPDCANTTTNGGDLPTNFNDSIINTNITIRAPPEYPSAVYSNAEVASNGVKVYVKEADRLNGFAFTNQSFPSWSPDCATEYAKKINYTISDLQYSVKKVDIDRKIADADMAAANSATGYRLDIEEDFTQLTNLVDTTGPTSQLIANPNITRALAVLSVPLDQAIQNSIAENSLVGTPTNMTSYQYNLGTLGRMPLRPVNVEKASFNNPLIQTEHISELIKTNEAMGYFTSNLNQVGMNFAVGRAFSLPGMFFDLMDAGSLMLLANYNTLSSGMKMFVHYIHPLRTITISREGIPRPASGSGRN